MQQQQDSVQRLKEKKSSLLHKIKPLLNQKLTSTITIWSNILHLCSSVARFDNDSDLFFF